MALVRREEALGVEGAAAEFLHAAALDAVGHALRGLESPAPHGTAIDELALPARGAECGPTSHSV